jgi:chromosome segregation ATPase
MMEKRYVYEYDYDYGLTFYDASDPKWQGDADDIADRLNSLTAEIERLTRARDSGRRMLESAADDVRLAHERIKALEEALTQIVKRDDWTSGECRHHARATLSRTAPEEES